MTVHEAHRLQELEEARGQLLRVFAKDGFCIAVFAWGCCSFPEEMEPQLREMGARDRGAPAGQISPPVGGLNGRNLPTEPKRMCP